MDNLAQRYAKRLMITRRVLIALVVILVVSFTAIFFKVDTEAHQVLREAKNVRVCMRLLAIEKYGLGKGMYDPDAKNGLAEGVEEELRTLSKEDGEIVLNAWNEEENLPKQFTYKKDNYIAVYEADSDKYKEWRIFITIKVLDYQNNEG